MMVNYLIINRKALTFDSFSKFKCKTFTVIQYFSTAVLLLSPTACDGSEVKLNNLRHRKSPYAIQ